MYIPLLKKSVQDRKSCRSFLQQMKLLMIKLCYVIANVSQTQARKPLRIKSCKIKKHLNISDELARIPIEGMVYFIRGLRLIED